MQNLCRVSLDQKQMSRSRASSVKAAASNRSAHVSTCSPPDQTSNPEVIPEVPLMSGFGKLQSFSLKLHRCENAASLRAVTGLGGEWGDETPCIWLESCAFRVDVSCRRQ